MRYTLQTVSNFIDKQTVALLGSLDQDGYPNIKAMLAPRKREGLEKFYLTTNISSLRTNQLSENPRSCLYFCDKHTFRGAMFLGVVKILTDQESKTMIWQEGDRIYYKKGVTDPDYCVYEFTAHKGRYYANLHSEDFPVK